MSIQVDDGEFTRLHNTILERLALARFTVSEYRCLMFLFRQTYGWQKKEDAISLSQWATGTGVNPDTQRGNVVRTLKGLLAKGVIYSKANGNNHPATWGFNKHFEQWDCALFNGEAVISRDSTAAITADNSSAPTVITEDNSTVITEDNKTVISRDNHKRKKEILKKRERERTPARKPAIKVIAYKSPHLDARHFVEGFVPAGTGRNAVEVYYERFCINQDGARLNSIKEDDLVLACKDLDRLREVVTAYSRTTFRPGNVQLILDWYRDGIPKKHQGPGHGAVSAAFTEQHRAALLTRAKTAQQNIRTAEKFGTAVDPQWQVDIQTAREAGVL